MSEDRSDEPFLSRWSRQKRQRPEPAQAEPPAAQEPAVDPASLPSIDDLTAASDISPFLRKGVPAALQQLALRRIWALDPSIRDFVEVAENQWDFNAAGGIPGLFEPIVPGADMSVWLAQAQQSASPQLDVPQPVATSRRAGDAALQQDHHAVPTPAAAFSGDGESGKINPSAEEEGPTPASEAVEIAGDSSAAEPPEVLPTRRRHGGALPR